MVLYAPILIGQGIDQIVAPGKVAFDQLLPILGELIAVALLGALFQWLMTLCTNMVTYKTCLLYTSLFLSLNAETVQKLLDDKIDFSVEQVKEQVDVFVGQDGKDVYKRQLQNSVLRMEPCQRNRLQLNPSYPHHWLMWLQRAKMCIRDRHSAPQSGWLP